VATCRCADRTHDIHGQSTRKRVLQKRYGCISADAGNKPASSPIHRPQNQRGLPRSTSVLMRFGCPRRILSWRTKKHANEGSTSELNPLGAIPRSSCRDADALPGRQYARVRRRFDVRDYRPCRVAVLCSACALRGQHHRAFNVSTSARFPGRKL
jgi:hypothetical protein